MSLCEVWYYEDEFYLRELYYKTGQTTDDLAIWMERNSISKTDYIFADSAEPDRIETLNTSRTIKKFLPDTNEEIDTYISRFNVHGAKKDIKAGIDYLKSKKIHLCSTSINAIKEINNYKYKEDKNGNIFDEPVKAFDDFLDSARYAIFSLNVVCNLSIAQEEKPGYSAVSYEGQKDVWGAMGF